MRQKILERINMLSKNNRIFEPPGYNRVFLDVMNKAVGKKIKEEIAKRKELFDIFEYEEEFIENNYIDHIIQNLNHQ